MTFKAVMKKLLKCFEKAKLEKDLNFQTVKFGSSL